VPLNSLVVYRRFGETYFLNLLGLTFNHHDGDSIFISNVGKLLPDYTMSHSRKQNFPGNIRVLYRIVLTFDFMDNRWKDKRIALIHLLMQVSTLR
jgi:hypothetical protein